MPSDAHQLDVAFKKLVGRRATTLNKEYYEELAGLLTAIIGDDVWVEAIPATPPGATTAVIEVHDTLTLTHDVTVADERSWLAQQPVGTQLRGFVTPRFGQGYTVRVFDNASTEIPTTDTVEWFFDYENGVLKFENDPTGTYSTPFKIKAYRYIGQTVADVLGPVSPSGGDTFEANCLSADAAGDVVYITADKVASMYQVSKVDYTDLAKMPPVGVIESKSSSVECIVRFNGILSGVYSGLTPNTEMYVDATSRLSSTPPTQPGSGLRFIQPMGHALSSTDVLINVRNRTALRP